MLKQTDIDEIATVERTPFVEFLLDGPTLILGCVRQNFVASFKRDYEGGRVFGADGYGLSRAQFRRCYTGAVRDCLAAKGILISYRTSFPTNDWLNKTTPETFVVWLYNNATQGARS